ncbi:hypothetical protein D3C79_493810 [compost metagenome]
MLPGAAEQVLRGHLGQLDKGQVIVLGVVAAGVLGADADQPYRLAFKRGFDLLAQVGLRLVEHHPHLQPGLAVGVFKQVDHGQVGQLLQQLAQRCRAHPLQGHGAWYGAWLDADQAVAVQLHFQDLVRVVDFGERQRDWRAAVADAFFAVDLLRLVQVAQGDVADGLVEQLGRQRLGVADDQAALGVLRHRATGHVRVADGDQRLVFLAFLQGGGDQLLVHLGDALQVIVTQLRAGDFGRPQEGQGQAPGSDLAPAVGQRNQQALGIQLTLVQPVHTAQRMGAQAAHECGGQLDARTGVVVAGDHHNVQLGLLLMGLDDEVVEAFLGFDGWVDGVEDVARNQQRIRLAQAQLAEQPVEEAGVFEVAFLAVQALAQVPVGGMKQTHG